MKQYEVTFIVSPVLSGDEIKSTAKVYEEMLTAAGCTIVHHEDLGIRELAYPINRRASGAYFCIEFQAENVDFLPKFELAFKRDERILRFLNIALDKFGVKYNQDKREGKIGKRVVKKAKTGDDIREIERPARKPRPDRAEPKAEVAEKAPLDEPLVAPVVAPPVVAEAPVAVAVEAPVAEAEAAETTAEA